MTSRAALSVKTLCCILALLLSSTSTLGEYGHKKSRRNLPNEHLKNTYISDKSGSTQLMGECIVYGDPHFLTFDSLHFNFQGKCAYILSKYCEEIDSPNTPFFQVAIDNTSIYPGSGTTIVAAVILKVINLTIFLHQENYITVNGETLVDSSFYRLGSNWLTIEIIGIYAIVTTNFGLYLRWDGKYNVVLRLSESYAGKVCGLCGNYDGNPSNDFTKLDKTMTESPEDFGDSFLANQLICEDPISLPAVSVCPNLEPSTLKTIKEYCGILTKLNGPFFECDQAQLFYNACEFDGCFSYPDTEKICGHIEMLAQLCRDQGASIRDWRTESPICH